MRVYYRPGTGRPVRVAWTLEEIGIPYESVAVSVEGAASPEHLARHPLGRVPVLETDGTVLFESTAVCLDLADRHPEAGLIAPIGSPDRAHVYQWAIFAMTEVEPPIVDVLRSRRTDPERAALSAERLGAASVVVERALDGREFLVGDHLTVADIVMCGVLALAVHFEIADQPPNIGAYVERLMARTGFQRASANTESLFAG